MTRGRKPKIKEVPKTAIVEVSASENPVVETKSREVVYQYLVAHGQCVNSKRGIIGPGTLVTESDFPGGIQTLEEHVKNNVLVKGEA